MMAAICSDGNHGDVDEDERMVMTNMKTMVTVILMTARKRCG